MNMRVYETRCDNPIMSVDDGVGLSIPEVAESGNAISNNANIGPERCPASSPVNDLSILNDTVESHGQLFGTRSPEYPAA
jgi:hypothetical protein